MNFQMLQILFLSAITLCAFITLGSEEVESFKTAGHFVFTYATAKELYLHNSFTNETETLFTLTNGMGSVECDPQRNLTFVYSTLLMNTTIHKVSFGGDAEVIANSSHLSRDVQGLAYDFLTGNIYVPNFHQISICQKENHCVEVIQEPNQANLVALHPNLGLMFWVTFWGGGIEDKQMLMRSGMDGSDKQFLTNLDKSHLYRVNGLSVDFKEEKLFWSYSRRDFIESSDFKGRGRTIIPVGELVWGIIVSGNRLFFRNSDSEIQSVDKHTGKDLVTHFRHWAMVDFKMCELHLIERENDCEHADCPGVCALSPVAGFQCLQKR